MSQRDVEKIAAEVTGCADCPLCGEWGDEGGMCGYRCQHPSEKDRDLDEKRYKPVTPGWCPLRAAPLVVRLKP